MNLAYSQGDLGLHVRDVGDVRGKTVLDVDCGVGHVTMELPRAGTPVTTPE